MTKFGSNNQAQLIDDLGNVNHATEAKQDDIIENQTDGSQKTQIVQSDGSTVSFDPLAKYKFADLDDDASPNYYGATDTAGNWYILKEDTTAKTLRYATGNSAYTTNWTNRVSLSYDYLFNVTVY